MTEAKSDIDAGGAGSALAGRPRSVAHLSSIGSRRARTARRFVIRPMMAGGRRTGGRSGTGYAASPAVCSRWASRGRIGSRSRRRPATSGFSPTSASYARGASPRPSTLRRATHCGSSGRTAGGPAAPAASASSPRRAKRPTTRPNRARSASWSRCLSRAVISTLRARWRAARVVRQLDRVGRGGQLAGTMLSCPRVRAWPWTVRATVRAVGRER
jgi:hypothetical protein